MNQAVAVSCPQPFCLEVQKPSSLHSVCAVGAMCSAPWADHSHHASMLLLKICGSRQNRWG